MRDKFCRCSVTLKKAPLLRIDTLSHAITRITIYDELRNESHVGKNGGKNSGILEAAVIDRETVLELIYY